MVASGSMAMHGLSAALLLSVTCNLLSALSTTTSSAPCRDINNFVLSLHKRSVLAQRIVNVLALYPWSDETTWPLLSEEGRKFGYNHGLLKFVLMHNSLQDENDILHVLPYSWFDPGSHTCERTWFNGSGHARISDIEYNEAQRQLPFVYHSRYPKGPLGPNGEFHPAFSRSSFMGRLIRTWNTVHTVHT
eukprot:CAMPEP_0181170024 /NCGR_PEP_ID=MMETSP1096-20121128/1136_1 /TAXON_ID=156174 ORGANISM="Chrysochromulina ericina, Strain CCMP281" /NCGR_SAMPLE_ID=MMETSP1096 /ASSEMBLY_ACC=CAM_ASM_000453 /LENGTH=189 /DNA_ID=CAMNT_0023257539 /DNA_START=460 /DNA_END=1029 /DNA_ORIENTATION=+